MDVGAAAAPGTEGRCPGGREGQRGAGRCGLCPDLAGGYVGICFLILWTLFCMLYFRIRIILAFQITGALRRFACP